MVTYTSSSLYWSPLKPRINVYAFSDSTYSSPIYTYNAFTDVGSTTKPISLNFDSETTNVGTFSIEIEDRDYELDPDTFMRGNRVFIECSKDGSTWQPAFKGLVRSSDQQIYATSGRNFTINGYSYLVRLNERVLNTIKESALVGEDYDRTDSNMFTDNLINDLLTTNSNYIYSDDDTALYSIFKKTNITSSPITDWIPRLDAQLVTVNDAINSVLEFSNGLIMLNPADDELVLYNPDLVTSATSIFLLTNQMNQAADDADYTMYPLEPYRYNISYDYPDSGSRLIGSIGEAVGDQCPEQGPSFPAVEPYDVGVSNRAMTTTDYAAIFIANGPEVRGLSFPMRATGDNSAATSATARIYTNSAPTTGAGSIGSQVGSDFLVYNDGIVDKPFPSSATYGSILSMGPGEVGPSLTTGIWYYVALIMTHTQDASNHMDWITDVKAQKTIEDPQYIYAYALCRHATSTTGGTSWSTVTNPMPGTITLQTQQETLYENFRYDFSFGGSAACGGGGGSQATIDADPVFAVAHDRNMSNRLGVVERVISGIPTHIKTAQTLNEYLYNKLYYAAKPRFTFDFPSVSMPNRIPKAGDIVAHVDSKARVGIQSAPIQTGIVSSIQYSFEQGKGKDDALGLRRLSLQTTGIKRGSY